MKHLKRQAFNVLFRLIAALFLLAIFLTGISMAAQQPVLTDENAIYGNILHFKAGRHMVGFTPEKAYFINADHALSAEFVGSNRVKPQDLSSIENNQNKKGPALLGRIEYKDLWPGITIRYDAVKDGVAESTYIVQPGADVSKIKLKYNAPVKLLKDGSLKIALKTQRGEMTESTPLAWQEIDGRKVPVKVSFSVHENEVGFSIGKYDVSLPVIIDPTYAWHTFYGDSSNDHVTGVAADGSGNVYVTGYSYGWNGSGTCSAPGVPPCPLHAQSGSFNIFVLKLDSSGAYVWHTFYGSHDANENHAAGIAIDGSGNIYVAGDSAASWDGSDECTTPGNPPCPLHAFSGVNKLNIFVLKLNSSGAYLWHTFYGSSGSDFDYATGIAVDVSGNVYATGYSWAPWNGPVSSNTPLHDYTGSDDIFVLKLNSSGAYQWHTFYGGDGMDEPHGIAIDGSGNLYVAGTSYSSWHGPTLADTPRHTHSGSGDIFALKLNSSGSYVWHTFYGSSALDNASGITVDGSGNAYITGYSNGAWGGPIHDFTGSNSNIVAMKLNSAGDLQWNTFWAGSAGNAFSIALDTNKSVYVTGSETTTWGSPLHDHNSGSNEDIVVLKLNSDGALQWNTFYGSISVDEGHGIAVDVNGNVFVAGISNATWQGEGPTDPLHGYAGGSDIVVLKLPLTICPAHAVLNGDTSSYFTSIQEAYGHASDGQSLLLQAMEFDEPDLTLSSVGNISVFLKGGYECDFLSNPGRSTLQGKLTISKGKATISDLIIK